MTNYELLRKRLNELLPDRLELKFGCEVCREGATKREFIAGKFADKVSLVRIDSNGAWMPFEIPMPPKSQEWIVLGTDVSITDILRGLNKTKNWKILIDSDGYVLGRSIGGDIITRINLSLHLSHPDNDVACGAIYQLLK